MGTSTIYAEAQQPPVIRGHGAIDRRDTKPSAARVSGVVAPASLSARQLMDFIRAFCATPHRRPGTPEGNRGEHFIANAFAKLGLTPVIDPVPVTVRDSVEAKLVVHTKGSALPIPASYVNTTAFTPKDGLTADLAYIGEGYANEYREEDVRGKIAVMKLRFKSLPYDFLKSIAFSVYDPDGTFVKGASEVTTWSRKNWPGWKDEVENDVTKNNYLLARQRGAKGIVFVLEDMPYKSISYSAPYGGPGPQNEMFRELPALYVSKESGQALIDALKGGAPVSATLTSTGTVTPGQMHNIHAVLPGKSREAIIIHSHTDAPHGGWVEDGTGMAIVHGLAEYFTKLPIEQRDKTLIFVASSGHFYGVKGMEQWVLKHKDGLLKDAVLSITAEHLAAKDFKADAEGRLQPTGQFATRALFVSDVPALRKLVDAAVRDHDLRRTFVVPPNALGKYPPGDAAPIHVHTTIPLVQYLSGPSYLLNAEDTEDKIDPRRLEADLKMFVDLVRRAATEPDEATRRVTGEDRRILDSRQASSLSLRRPCLTRRSRK